MKTKGMTIIVLIVILVITVLFFTAFQVRETESALVTRFGEPVRDVTEPGLHFKWPPPIESVHVFDSRNRVFEVDLRETTTRGAVPIIVKTYVVWNIAEPLTFFNSVGTVLEAERNIRTQLSDTQNRVIGRHHFSDFVNSDPDEIKFVQIEEQMLTDLGPTLMDNYGIQANAVGIKRLQVSEDVSENVFERMRAERNRMTDDILSQGMALAQRIRADADAKKKEILNMAEARAMRIRGEGDAEAATYYRMLDADPELAMFLRDLEALRKTLEKRTTIILSADTEPFKLLKQMPTFEPKDPSVVAEELEEREETDMPLVRQQ